MKYLFTFLFLISLSYNGYASVYDKLCDVNKLWQENDVADIKFPEDKQRTSQEWIQLHLSLVEQVLRSRNTDDLSAGQRSNRNTALDCLHEYWQAGKFPQNTEYGYRTPIFIDKYDNFCAVGYLVKTTGHEEVSRMISSKTNLAYVREMHYPELDSWAVEYGFTKDELAWIQPAYGPRYSLHNISYGVNGNVKELFVDDVSNILYVGGDFDTVDNDLATSNIAYVTQTPTEYIWHSMGLGVNGTVTAICQYSNNVIVAGSFTIADGISVDNIAKWDGANWSPLGCVTGIINDLVVYNNELFALGYFDICQDITNVNFAKWDGTKWTAIQGLNGTLNVGKIIDADLFIGGAFSYGGNIENAIKWDGDQFQKFNNSVINEVNDFEYFDTSVYVGCKLSSLDTTLLLRNYNGTWLPVLNMQYFSSSNNLSINTLNIDGNNLVAAGDFKLFSMYSIMNSLSVRAGYSYDWFGADSVVNKMVSFNGRLIAGGSFTDGIGRKGDQNNLSAFITTRPSCNGNGSISAAGFQGVPPYKYKWSTGDTSSSLFNLLPGNYQLEIRDSDYNIFSHSIIITGANKIDSIEYDNKTPYKFLIVHGPAPGAVYSMVNCSDYSNVITQNNQPIFYVDRDGDYAFIVDQNGCIDTSDCIHVNIFPENVAAISSMDGISIYPNPTENTLHISTGNTLLAQVQIIDLTGRVIMKQVTNKESDIQLNLSSLDSGYYTVIIIAADGSSKQYKLTKK